MMKCSICGKEIPKDAFHYNFAPDTYVCDEEDCYLTYYWNDLVARVSANFWHEYVVYDRCIYLIGSDEDEPRGYGGQHWTIDFNDGVHRETNSLWFLGCVPDTWEDKVKDNAKLVKGIE